MKALLVSVSYPGMDYDPYKSLDELKQLCYACNIEPVLFAHQNLDHKEPSTLIGSGKVVELSRISDQFDMVIFDEELTPMQAVNLSDAIGKEATDRSDLILRIFESRVASKEAKLQVMIAKNNYLLPRLQGSQERMSHQQGGSGFRGSGEKQIELDKRKIYRELVSANRQLEKMVKQRQNQRKQRQNEKVIALVGYTNSGKSTIMNLFTQKQVLQEDMLFATLQTATRRIKINGHPCLLTDTVGFISRLPHHLVKAFRSTLEEVKEADLLLQVVDCSDSDYDEHIKVTNEVLKSLGVENTPMIYVMNKMDLGVAKYVPHEDNCVFISAKNHDNIDILQKKISAVLFKDWNVYHLRINYEDGNILNWLYNNTIVQDVQYEDSIYVRIEAHPSMLRHFEKYCLSN